MEINSRTLAGEVIADPFDPLLCVRLHSSTQLKRRMTGQVGAQLMAGERKFLDAFQYIDSLPLTAFEAQDWPELLAQNPDTDIQAEPLDRTEEIPLEVFRAIRTIQGSHVMLSRNLIEQAKTMGESMCARESFPADIQKLCVADSWGPLLITTILEKLRQKGLLSHFAIQIDAPNETVLDVLNMLRATNMTVKEMLQLDKSFRR